MAETPVLPLPARQMAPADPLTAYRDLLTASPTISPNQPLFMVTKETTVITSAISMLARSRALAVMLQSLGLDTTLYSFHSLRRGWGSTIAHRLGIDQLDIND